MISRLAVGLVLAFGGCARVERAALPEATLLDPVWSVSAPLPGVDVDHAPWDAFLSRYLTAASDGVSRLAYAEVAIEDRAALGAYLDRLAHVDPRELTRDQQLAYWINLYNAQTVAIVLDAYPVGSIRAITDGLLSFGPWDRQVVTVNGTPLSLNDIEHRIIRPVFAEPRIHYALNCAAVGCPDLRGEAWRAIGLDDALAAAEHAYVNDLRGVALDLGGRLTLSKIYVWFREDFGADEAAVIAHVAAAAEPRLRRRLEGRTRVDAYAYDWSLNDQATAP
ncbi:MAG: DUF547 domain-containing protein [Pseudomonadota bacterium]